MAAIETSTPQLSAGGPLLSGRGRGRRRHHGGRGGRGTGASDTARETADVVLDGYDIQNHEEQQQPHPSGSRHRPRRPNGPRGEPHTPGIENTPTEQQNLEIQPTGASKNHRPWNRSRRGRGGGLSNEAAGHQGGQPQQLNWQQQLLLDNTQQYPQHIRDRGGGHRGGRGGGTQQQGRNRRVQAETTATLDALTAPSILVPRNGRPGRARIAPPRDFGAQLTSNEATASSLRPNAPAFQPGKPAQDDTTSIGDSSEPGNLDISEPVAILTQPKRAPVQKPVKSVKEAEDLMTRIHNGLASGAYECMICYGGVTRKSQVWNCTRCYAVFHLKCISRWAKQGLEAPLPPNALENGEERRRAWRCPGCQNPEEEAPSTYTCWCGKTQDPDAQRYIPPHSCGQTCGKERTSPRACPHACSLQCHAGPCPPCTAMGPAQACFCGKEYIQRRCLDTDYENGWSCQQTCGDFMPCGDHTCPRPCHSGMCGDCEFAEELRCYCGKENKGVRCCDKGQATRSLDHTEEGTAEWIGHWSCKTSCNRNFDCGVHACRKACHSIDIKPAHCPLSPDAITHCPCGKTNLSEILSSPRRSCVDPIPSCHKTCNKTLKCGHTCQRICHTDECGVCLQPVNITCRCGRTVSPSICHQGGSYEPPQCMKTCKAMLNCQLHECGEKCCSGESAAMERIATSKKRKNRPLNSAPSRSEETYEPEHICTRPCVKLLKCGKHQCPMLCHRGPCGTCLEASFEELACHCGRTVIQPPVPCGSRPPQCTYQCTRPKTCGHPAIPHNCHGDEEACPKCPYLTIKRCICGKKEVKNQPCWRDSVTCGTICGRKLSCGSHTCKRVCHKAGNCDEPCTQSCGKPKSCGHMCADACHAPFQCSETPPCQSKIQISCVCGGIKQEIKCNATKSSPGNTGKEIKCNDTCRARRMALALEIDPDRDSSQQMGYCDLTIEIYHEQPKQFTQSVEKTLKAFAEAPQKRYAFQPMKSQLRAFIHSLAADYGFESESQDPEPYRSVVVMKGPKFSTAPKKTIAQFIQSSAKSSGATTHTPTPTPLIEQLRKPAKLPMNGLVLEDIRVGLLMKELEKELEPILSSTQLRFNIHWTGDEEVILEPKTSSFGIDEVDLELSNLKPLLRRTVKAKGLAQEVELCWVGKDGKIVHKESRGWAMVAGSSKAPSSSSSYSAPTWAGRAGISIAPNGFSALDPSSAGRMVALGVSKSSESLREKARKEKERREKEKKKREEEVVDDWEMAADEEEQEEAQKIGGDVTKGGESVVVATLTALQTPVINVGGEVEEGVTETLATL